MYVYIYKYTTTKTVTESFREMKVVCKYIFMSIFLANGITDSWGMCLSILLTKLMVFNLRRGKFTG